MTIQLGRQFQKPDGLWVCRNLIFIFAGQPIGKLVDEVADTHPRKTVCGTAGA